MSTRVLLLTVAALLPALPLAAQARERLPELRVLYAGDPDTPHTRAYLAFLREHFQKVDFAAVLGLAERELAGHDVLVVDGQILDRSGETPRILASPDGLTLEKLAIPTVLIGGMGGRISDQLQLKLGWRYG